jgi:hypothetical protein
VESLAPFARRHGADAVQITGGATAPQLFSFDTIGFNRAMLFLIGDLAVARRARAVALAVGLLCGSRADGAPQVVTTPDPAVSTTVRPHAEFELGADERFRFEGFNDLVDHSDAAEDQRIQWRFRTRAWARGRLGDYVAFGVGLTNESRGQGVPRLPLTLDETVFESLWIGVVPHPRFSIRLGRQTIKRGDGLILWDATPSDGARTEYINGLDATVTVARDAKVEVIVASDPSYDVYLPVIHNRNRRLIEWRERLAGAYFTDTRRPGLDLQAYYFFKREDHDTRPSTNPQFQPDRSLSTAGCRVVRVMRPAWTLYGEAAAQFGEQVPQTAIRAFAGSVGTDYRLSAPWAPTLRASYAGLSGDSLSTTTIERWDPIVARWPNWSEVIVQTLLPEVGQGYWTNMGIWRAEVTLKPSRQTIVRATCSHLTAFHPFPGPPAIFGSGTTRGDVLEGRFDFSLTPTLKGNVLGGRFFPGSFYAGRTPGYAFRVELTATFQHRWQ